jgi:hypothetical protein
MFAPVGLKTTAVRTNGFWPFEPR